MSRLPSGLRVEGGQSLSTLKTAYARSAEEVLRILDSDEAVGLTSAAVTARTKQFGRNELLQRPGETWWRRLLRQFADLLIWILIAAAIVSGVLGEWVDAIAILSIVVLNGLLGFVQEGRADQALKALRKLSTPQSKVIRDGRLQNLPASELVPGDRIELEPGDRIPADVRLIDSAGLHVQEAALTGESVPAEKDHSAVLDPLAPLGDRVNMAYMDTSVAAGTASAVVVATGMATEIGQIAGMLDRQGIEPTPLQRRLAEMGRTLLYAVLAIVAVMFFVQMLRGGRVLDAFLLSVSLAVAAVPEGLSTVVTVALALGLQRMARRNALIRRLPSVETLGAVTVICTDKTGTLTRNEMTVREIAAGGVLYDVTGGGYEPVGKFQIPAMIPGHAAESLDPATQLDLLQLLRVGAWCNHAQVTPKPDDGSKWEIVGDPTEAALAVAAMKAGVEATDREQHIVHEIPFSSDRKAMSVVVQMEDGERLLYTKGAPEVVLGKCAQETFAGAVRELTPARRIELQQSARGMGELALRVLGLAYRKTVDGEPVHETNLIFAGLVGMMDPPRDEARVAVGRCLTAGIRPVMITGDHPDTARAIAMDLQIMQTGDRVALGSELDGMNDATLTAEVQHIAVYARVTAAHKLRIVKAWRARHQVVAMTGDGVNDAPAIQAADVGVAMGVTGTDVTKEAADMVLTDDNFASIVNAVEEGRTIYDNIRKCIHYLLATNAGEVMFMFGAIVVGWPSPLVPIQLLWINLVTDALPAMALGVEPPEPDVMQRPPRPPNQPVITGRRGWRLLYHGALNASASALAFYLVYQGMEQNIAAARTAAFFTAAFAQLMFSFGCRSDSRTLPQLGFFSNLWLTGAIVVSALVQAAVVAVPFLRPVFKVVPMPYTWDWTLIAGLALMPVTVIEVTKLIQHFVKTRRGR